MIWVGGLSPPIFGRNMFSWNFPRGHWHRAQNRHNVAARGTNIIYCHVYPFKNTVKPAAKSMGPLNSQTRLGREPHLLLMVSIWGKLLACFICTWVWVTCKVVQRMKWMITCIVLQRLSTEVFAITSTKLRKVSPGPLTFISPGVLMPLSLIAHSAPK